MAGMFYSLQEVVEKLNKTEDQVRELVREGKLREFRDGRNLLYKIDEVEALTAENQPEALEETAIELPPQIEDEIILEEDESETPEAPQQPSPDESAAIPEELSLAEDIDTEAEKVQESPQEKEQPVPDESSALVEGLSLVEDTEAEKAQEAAQSQDESAALLDELSLAEDTETEAEKVKESPQEQGQPLSDESAAMLDELMSEDTGEVSSEELSILDEPKEQKIPEGTGSLDALDLTGADTTVEPVPPVADTAAAGEGLNILSDTDKEYEIAEDTAADTQLSSEEASLKEIEDDVNLDTFGSGSGLLDLSLQADDTSLGGILDEIYAPEGQAEQGLAPPGSAMDMAAQTEQMLAEASQAGLDMPAIAQAYAEPEPDAASNAFGIMMILPLLAIIYTGIMAVAGFNDIIPAIFKPIQSFIWYIMGGLLVLSLVIIGLPLLSSSSASTAKPKAKKTPKEKKPKQKKKPKEKKPKKEKKAKKGKG